MPPEAAAQFLVQALQAHYGIFLAGHSFGSGCLDFGNQPAFAGESVA